MLLLSISTLCSSPSASCCKIILKIIIFTPCMMPSCSGKSSFVLLLFLSFLLLPFAPSLPSSSLPLPLLHPFLSLPSLSSHSLSPASFSPFPLLLVFLLLLSLQHQSYTKIQFRKYGLSSYVHGTLLNTMKYEAGEAKILPLKRRDKTGTKCIRFKMSKKKYTIKEVLKEAFRKRWYWRIKGHGLRLEEVLSNSVGKAYAL